MLSLSLVGAVLFFMPGLAFLAVFSVGSGSRNLSTKLPSTGASGSLLVVGITSTLTHLMTLSLLWGLGYLSPNIAQPWNLIPVSMPTGYVVQVDQIIVTLGYGALATLVGAILADITSRLIPKSKGATTLSSMIFEQENDDSKILVAYVYMRDQADASGRAFSGIVGGVSRVRLNSDHSIDSLALISPMPFSRTIMNDGSLHIEDYGTENTDLATEDELQTTTIVELAGCECQEVVYALHVIPEQLETIAEAVESSEAALP